MLDLHRFSQLPRKDTALPWLISPTILWPEAWSFRVARSHRASDAGSLSGTITVELLKVISIHPHEVAEVNVLETKWHLPSLTSRPSQNPHPLLFAENELDYDQCTLPR